VTASGNGNPDDKEPKDGATGFGTSDEAAATPASSPDEGAFGLAPKDEDDTAGSLRKELEALRLERDDLRDQLLRRRADFENFRKRAERDRQQAGFEATAAVFRDLIPALDNLERALDAGGDETSLRMGVELIHRELLSLLDSHGVTAHDPTGQPFEPERHQALLHEEAPGFADGTVVETFRKGYYFKDRLLRPALVKVAKGANPQETAESDGVH
jgi:molecular chaperone GrpE